MVLSYRRGKFSTTSDEIRGARSIGFGGHVSYEDADFFDAANSGVLNNAVRELREELRLDPVEARRLEDNRFLHLFSFLNVDDTDDARRHLAAVLMFWCSPTFEPRKGELSINDLTWLSWKRRPNNSGDFELWSQLLIEHLNGPDFQLRMNRMQALTGA